jgi:phosphomannomutase/phosphoglucomutase
MERHKVNATIFREYDIRGIADSDLTDDIVETFGKAYGTYINGGNIIIGRDNRLSSIRIRNALVKGLLSTGCTITDIGLTITPAYYFTITEYQADGGLMVTASHNPSEYNGFKVNKGNQTIYGDEIQMLRKIVELGKFLKGRGTIVEKDTKEKYIQEVVSKIKLKKKFKVVVDCGNGTASLFAPKILEKFGCKIIPLYCESDGRFPNHLPDPVKLEYAKDLITLVKKEKADLGFGFDGDGDRLGAVDEKGNMVWGDMLLILFFRELLEKHPGAKCIIEVKCSQSLVDDVKTHGGIPIIYKTGHSLIKAKMAEEHALLTGEMSGHMFFKDEYYGYDDALYAAGRLLRILSLTDKKFSELFSDVSVYYATPEMRPYCPDDKKFEIVKKIVSFFKKNYEVIDVDGARVVFKDGWGLIRSSNTQPALIVRCEGKTPEARDRIKKVLFDKLSEFPEIKEEKSH